MRIELGSKLKGPFQPELGGWVFEREMETEISFRNCAGILSLKSAIRT